METFGFESVRRNLLKWAEEAEAEQNARMGELAAALEDWAKSEHPWQNRRGVTEASIQAAVTVANHYQTVVRVQVGFDAGIWLELARGGKWSWLWPVIESHAEDIKAILARAHVIAIDPVRRADVTEQYLAAKEAIYSERGAVAKPGLYDSNARRGEMFRGR